MKFKNALKEYSPAKSKDIVKIMAAKRWQGLDNTTLNKLFGYVYINKYDECFIRAK